MSEQLLHVQARARAFKFIGWRPIAFEMIFEPGYSEAHEWHFSPSAQEELDALCLRARRRDKRRDPQAA